MSKPRLYGAAAAYMPNNKADLRRNPKQFLYAQKITQRRKTDEHAHQNHQVANSR